MRAFLDLDSGGKKQKSKEIDFPVNELISLIQDLENG